MRIYSCADYQEMSRKAASIIASQIIMKPNCVLGLATGSTPIGTYNQLVEWCDNKELDFSQVRSVNLDEYRGLGPDHDQSYRYFMQTNLFDRVNIDVANTNVPNGKAEDPAAECARYDQVIQDMGGIDLQLLGLGRNGHIGFNEPDDVFQTGTHLVDLTESTIDANKRFFASEADVPRQALTMGVLAIMQAKTVLMVVSGADKAEAVAKSFSGPVDPQVPASILQLHPDVRLVADLAALSILKEKGFPV